MQFLTKNDITNRVHATILQQITNGDDTQLDPAEADAIGIITDMISGLYDIETELTKTGDERHRSLLQWIVSIAVYNLYAHIPDNEVPERVIKDYDDTLKTLDDIAKGKRPTTLTPVTNDDGEDIRFIRYGFNDQRGHSML